ncbi:T9SS type A sorting domain-containing protein [Aureispira anguillae]|uniref:T9SS type A sorting domain-containing protein n=1 Tax=Aureispira anguillae TaxID=2864201 RepID=A0A916DNV6_9BACT|nr:T9SS type A sorting domain-containing protein [Aureispira anguillae]BDS10134.1 T9SS type A sorting domain-containing protein [Aureispira anguillae]
MKQTVITLLLFSIIYSITAQQDTCLNNLTLGISFPPVADNTQRSFAKNHLDFLGVTKIRFAENWAFREPSQGNFNWQPLDDRINWAYNNGYEILLTIQSNAPNWACSVLQNPQSCVFNNNNDFKTYIDLLLQRYPNKISKIQFGNEWQASYWYVGSANDFIQANNILYHAVQTHSPTTKVVLGGFTTISLRFLAGCNGYVNSFYDDDGVFYDATYLATHCPTPAIQNVVNRIDSVLQYAEYDMIDLHFYDDVEQWDDYYLNFSDTISKPIIVSEFGGPNMNYEPYSDAFQADRIFKYVNTLDSLQIAEAYFFKLVEGTANPAHSTSGLIDDTTLLEKPAYHLFKAFIACSPLSIQDFQYDKKIKFYPNPMKDYTTIEFQEKNQGNEKTISIYGSNGKIVWFKEGIYNNYYTLKRGTLTAGFYSVKIRDKTGVIARGKLIVE